MVEHVGRRSPGLSLGFRGGKQLFHCRHFAAPNQILMRLFHFLIISLHFMYFHSISALIYFSKEKKLNGYPLRPIVSSREHAA